MVAIALEHLHPLSNAWTVMEGSRTVRSSYTVNIDSSYRHKTVTEEQPSAKSNKTAFTLQILQRFHIYSQYHKSGARIQKLHGIQR